MLVDNINVEEAVDINGVLLEKGNYQSKDFCFSSYNQYKIDKDGNVNLIYCEAHIKNYSKKDKEKFLLKPNGIIHIFDWHGSNPQYKLVLEQGVIKKLYRADSSEDFEKFPKHIQRNYDAVWK